MKLLNRIPSFLKNKYFLALAAFAVVMLFLDKNDIFSNMARNKELRELKESKVYYTKEINELSQEKQNLINAPKTIVRYAREKTLMKRENEDLFLVSEKPDKSNN